jgi:hypothetical protein
MQLVISPGGAVRCIYDETIDVITLGQPRIQRASHVEPDGRGQWIADLAPVGGPKLGPYLRRSDALTAEHQWLETHWLTQSF